MSSVKSRRGILISAQKPFDFWKKKSPLVGVIMAVVVIVGAIIYHHIQVSACRTETEVTMDKLLRTVAQANPESNVIEITEETVRQHPEVRVGRMWILDGWNRPIGISVDVGQVELRSAGNDGKLRTKDDLVKTGTIKAAEQ